MVMVAKPGEAERRADLDFNRLLERERESLDAWLAHDSAVGVEDRHLDFPDGEALEGVCEEPVLVGRDTDRVLRAVLVQLAFDSDQIEVRHSLTRQCVDGPPLDPRESRPQVG